MEYYFNRLLVYLKRHTKFPLPLPLQVNNKISQTVCLFALFLVFSARFWYLIKVTRCQVRRWWIGNRFLQDYLWICFKAGGFVYWKSNIRNHVLKNRFIFESYHCSLSLSMFVVLIRKWPVKITFFVVVCFFDLILRFALNVKLSR